MEREYNHLFVGKTVSPVHPDPDEVHETVFVGRDELEALHQQNPFSAWFRTVLDHALPEVRRIAPSGRW